MSEVPFAEWEMVIIGFNRGLKETDKPLSSRVPDAYLVAETAKCCGLCEDPLLVTDEKEEWGKESLKGEFKVAAERLKKSNKRNLLVYYGGHGFRDLGLTIIVPKGLECADAAFVLQRMVVDTLAECNCESINLLVISAACGDMMPDDEEEDEESDIRYVREIWNRLYERGWMQPFNPGEGNLFVTRKMEVGQFVHETFERVLKLSLKNILTFAFLIASWLSDGGDVMVLMSLKHV